MLLVRCAWHPKHFGRKKFMGIKAVFSDGLRVRVSHGICGECRRHELAEALARRPAARR